MIKITNDNINDIVQKSDKLVVVDFWAEWCGPCHMIAPVLNEISEEYSDKIIVGKCNVDENPTIPSKFGIRNIPTVLFFKNGQAIDKQVGAVTKSIYVNKINVLLQ
jgi:thioredoxin 1